MAKRNVEYIIGLRDNFSSKLAGINKKLQVTGQKIQSIGRTMTLAVTLPIVALGAATVKLASDFEETESKFNTVFSSIREQANETANNLKKNFGLSSRASLQLLGDTGDLLVGFGFTEKAALEMSQQVNELAVDLASFTNVQGGAQSASAALTKALLGERESVKTLGISILESDVKARVLLNTQKGLRFESNRQAKAFATLQIAQSQSQKAIGDFARTSGSFANQLRITRARLEDLGIQLGKVLLPTAQRLLKIVKGWIERFMQLSTATKRIIVIVAGLVAALGPLLLILGTLMTTVIPGLVTAFTFLTGPIGLIIVAIAALTIGVFALRKSENKMIQVQKRLNAAFVTANKETEKQKQILRDLIFLLNSKSKADFVQKRALSELQKIFPKYFKNLDIEKAKLVDIDLLQRKIAKGNELRVFAIERIRAQERLERIKGAKFDPTGKFATPEGQIRFEKEREKSIRQQRGVIANLVLQARKVGNDIARLQIQEKIEKAKKKIADFTASGAAGAAGTTTRIVSASPKTIIINIEKLVENINNNVTNLKEGMNESKKVITEVLLSALNDASVLAR